jgi:hypothetical protein
MITSRWFESAAFVILASTIAAAQIEAGTQASVQFIQSANSPTQLAVNKGRPSFGWQLDVFATARITSSIDAFSSIRVMDDQKLNIDELAVRIQNITALDLTFQAGKMNLPFGNLGDRRYPRRNPLYSLPLIYRYQTSLPAYPTTEYGVSWYKGRGLGMKMLDGYLYDYGAMVSGTEGILDYAFAIQTGTVSVTSYDSPNSNSDFGKILRLSVTPFTGFTLGAGYAWGAYIDDSYRVTRAIDVNTYVQHTVEADVDFSIGYLQLNAQGVFSTWPVPFETRDQDLSAFGYYVEAKYTIMPRLFAAGRVNGLVFQNATVSGTDAPWDYNVTEWEGGVGYFLDRDVVMKLIRRETRTYGTSAPKDHLTVIQIAVAY